VVVIIVYINLKRFNHLFKIFHHSAECSVTIQHFEVDLACIQYHLQDNSKTTIIAGKIRAQTTLIASHEMSITP
jgi:hypothetical protein